MDSEFLRKRISETKDKDDFSHFLDTLGKRKDYSIYRLKAPGGSVSFIAADRKTAGEEKKDGSFPKNPFAETRFALENRHDGKVLRVISVNTDEGMRKLRIQKALFSLIEQEANNHNARIELRADEDMAEFYGKLGFKRVLKTGEEEKLTFVKQPAKFPNFKLKPRKRI